MKKLTIITVVKDELRAFETTLESIRNQMSTDFVWLVIDGSQEPTRESVKRLTLENAFAKHYVQQPKGIYSAMNYGIEKADDSWILFLNAGDTFFDQNSVSKLNIILESSRPDVRAYGFSVEHILHSGEVWDTTIPKIGSTSKKGYNSALINHQGFVALKSEITKYDRFDESLKFAADGKLMDQIVSNSKVELHYFTLTKFRLGGRSGLNYRKVNEEISTYRPAGVQSSAKPRPFKNQIRIVVIQLLERFPLLAKPIIRIRKFL